MAAWLILADHFSPMHSYLYYLPIAGAATVYLVRMAEVSRKRETVAGKVQENRPCG